MTRGKRRTLLLGVRRGQNRSKFWGHAPVGATTRKRLENTETANRGEKISNKKKVEPRVETILSLGSRQEGALCVNLCRGNDFWGPLGNSIGWRIGKGGGKCNAGQNLTRARAKLGLHLVPMGGVKSQLGPSYSKTWTSTKNPITKLHGAQPQNEGRSLYWCNSQQKV